MTVDAETLHRRAYHHNWDDGDEEIYAILDHPNCDRATAVMLFWLASPTYYQRFRTRKEIPSYNQDGWDLVQCILRRFANGRYPTAELYYEGSAEVAPEDAQWAIPADLYGPVGTPPPVPLPELVSDAKALRAAVDAGRDPDERSLRGYAALHLAAKGGHRDAIQVLLDAGASLEQRDNEGQTALVHAIRAGHDAVVTQLVAAGMDPGRTGATGFTPLHMACASGQTNTVQALLAAGADPSVRDGSGRSALLHAAASGSVSTFDVVFAVHPALDEVDHSGWGVGQHGGRSLPLAKHLHALGVDFTRLVQMEEKDTTMLHMAVLWKRVEMVRWLVEEVGIPVDVEQQFMQRTPLALVKLPRHLNPPPPLVSTLLELGADPRRGGQAVVIGQDPRGLAMALEQLRSEPWGKQERDWLFCTMRSPYLWVEGFALLLDAAMARDPDCDLHALLRRAVKGGSADIVKMLLARGGDPDQTDARAIASEEIGAVLDGA